MSINWTEAPLLAALQHVSIGPTVGTYWGCLLQTRTVVFDRFNAATLELTERFNLQPSTYNDAFRRHRISHSFLKRPVQRLFLEGVHYLFSNAQRTKFDQTEQERSVPAYMLGARVAELEQVHPYISTLQIRYPYLVISTSVHVYRHQSFGEQMLRIFWGLPL